MTALKYQSLKDFETYLYEEEKSVNTIEKYVRDVHAFLSYAGDAEITKQVVLQFKKQLSATKAVTSANSMLASVKTSHPSLGAGSVTVKAVLPLTMFTTNWPSCTVSVQGRFCVAAVAR